MLLAYGLSSYQAVRTGAVASQSSSVTGGEGLKTVDGVRGLRGREVDVRYWSEGGQRGEGGGGLEGGRQGAEQLLLFLTQWRRKIRRLEV